MNRNVFKCCPKKSFSSSICIFCFDVFHGSCLDRKSDIVRLGGYKILCSPSCQRNHQIAEEQEKNYKQMIDKLQNEITEKNHCLKRLKRNSKVFEDDVLETEQKYIDTIAEQKQRIIQLKSEVSMLNEANIELKADIRSTEARMAQLEKQVQELHDMSRSMITTIQILENENRIHLDELDKVKQGGNDKEMISAESFEPENGMYVNDLNEANAANKETDNVIQFQLLQKNEKSHSPKKSDKGNEVPTLKSLNCNIRRILILSDQHGYSLGSLIQNSAKGLCVQSVIKPNAIFANVILNIADLTRDFTLNDYVVVLAGYNDLRDGHYPLFKNINRVLKNLGHTNLLVVSVPSKHSDPKVINAISKFNSGLSRYINRLNQCVEGHFCFLECNLRGFPQRKKDLSKNIINILFSKPCNKNLVFVKVCDSYKNAPLSNYSDDLNTSAGSGAATDNDIARHPLVDNSDNGLPTSQDTNFLGLSPIIIDP